MRDCGLTLSLGTVGDRDLPQCAATREGESGDRPQDGSGPAGPRLSQLLTSPTSPLLGTSARPIMSMSNTSVNVARSAGAAVTRPPIVIRGASLPAGGHAPPKAWAHCLGTHAGGPASVHEDLLDLQVPLQARHLPHRPEGLQIRSEWPNLSPRPLTPLTRH
jgi:hypothetical protein